MRLRPFLAAAVLLLAVVRIASADPLPPGCEPEPLPHVGRVASAVEDAIRASIGNETAVAHTRTLRWSEARKWIYAYHANDEGQVWDVYGERWLRGPGLPEEKEVNVEHTWPQSRFEYGWDGVKVRGLLADGMRGDLHNLFPTEVALNSERANKPFAELGDCAHRGCSTETGYEVPDAHKGNAARALFYFSVRYGLAIPETMEPLLRAWSAGDPVDDAERTRNDAIAKIQGNRNPFIDDETLVKVIADF